MLSIHNVASASGGASYYLKTAEYYQGEGGIEKPEFQGKHINSLVGGEEFTTEKFTKLLNGELPDGKRLGKTEQGEIKHRPGVDLTFSAPKSLSILALIDGRIELLDAHKRAVTETIDYIEKNLSFTRNNAELEKVDNVNVAKFLETMSRANDPQLHTHCVVLNMVKRDDGRWRSMVTDSFYDNKMMLGQLYRSSLAKILVHELGYQIDVNKSDGTFEIRGIPGHLIQQFSKRRSVIEKIAANLGVTSAAGLQTISTNSRGRAADLLPSQALTIWKHEVSIRQGDLSTIIPDSKVVITQANKNKIAKDAVSVSINKLDTFLRFYTKEEVTFHAMQQSMDKAVCPIQIDKVIEKAIQNNSLIPITKEQNLFISGNTYREEIKLKEICQKSWALRHLHFGEVLKHVFRKFVVKDDGTVDGLAFALNANHWASIVDNFLPSLDHQALSRALRISDAQGKKTNVIALSSVDRDNLSSHGIESLGLNKYVKSEAKKHGIVFVAGAEKATFYHINKLMECAKEKNLKIIMLNAKDNPSIDTRYSPIELMAESGIKRVSMRDSAEMSVLVVNIFNQAKKIIDVSDVSAIAEHFTERKNGLLICSNPGKLNHAIRKEFIKKGLIKNDSVTLNNYTYKYLTDIELNRTVNYLEGDLIKVENLGMLRGTSNKIKEGDHFRVIKSENHDLTIEHGKIKQQFKINLDKTRITFQDLKVFKQRDMEVAVGDKILLPRDNIYGKRFLNRIGTIAFVTENSIKIDLGDKELFELYTKNREVFLERGWAVSPHRQVKGFSDVIDVHLAPESAKNVLKNLSEVKIKNIGNVYIKDADNVFKSIEQMSSKLNFVSHEKHSLILENIRGEKIKEITREIKQTQKDRDLLADNSVNIGVNKITEKNFSFKKEDIFREASAISVGSLNSVEIGAAIEKLVRADSIIMLENESGNVLYTTKELLIKKQKTLDAICKKIDVICSESRALQNLKAFNIDIPEEHKNVVTGLLSSDRAISLVQGFAGTAKTSLTLKHFARIAKESGYDVRGYAPTHSACIELKNKAGINAMTVESAMQLIHKTKFNINHKTVVIIDESSMLSINDTVGLINACSHNGAKLVFVGDQNQQPSVGAGEIFREIINNGKADVHYIKNILRQKTPEYRDAVQCLAHGDVDAFFDKMKNKLVQVKGIDKETASMADLVHAISLEYADTSKHTKDQTQIITLTNESRNEINQTVRRMLMGKNELSETSLKVTTYQSIDHSMATKHFASTLSAGNAIRFNSPDERYGVMAGEYLVILSVSDKDNTLTLIREDGSMLPIRPDRSSLMARGGIEVYRQEERQLAVGEKIIFRRSIEDVGIRNTDIGKIVDITADIAKISFKDRVVQFDLTKPDNRHWDYGYAITSHVYQGKDCETVLFHFDTRLKPIAHYQSFYVAVTRGEYSMKMFTDNIEIAKNNVLSTYLSKNLRSKFKAEPVMQHEVTTQYEDVKKFQSLEPIERKRLSEESALICRSIIGEPLRIRGSTFYYGKKGGSLRIETEGEKAGLWHDFATGDGGDIIDLIKHSTNATFKESIDTARKIVGEGYSGSHTYGIDQRKEPDKQADNTSKIERARTIFNSGIVITGTVGEKYLLEHRKIPVSTLERAATEIRFIPEFHFDNTSDKKFNAIAFAAKNARGKVQAVQVVLLDKKTGQKLPGQSKYSFGAMKGASMTLGKQGSEVYIAEGPETALSVFAAKPDSDVRAVFSVENIKNTFIPLSVKSITICADNDGVASPSERAVNKGIEAMRTQVPEVCVVMPLEAGKDFNDLIQQDGVSAVRVALEKFPQKEKSLMQLERQI